MPSLPPAREMVARLVSLPSMSSPDPRFDQSNRAVIDALANWAWAVGFEVRVQALPGSSSKANLIAKLGQGEGGLVLSGHTDTVPYDEARWRSDPFSLTDVDGSWVGLGAADMKAFFAAALHAVQVAGLKDPARPIYLVATADEESTMDGARALHEEEAVRADYAVIGEPTDLRPVHKHKGVLMVRIALTGRSGHSSDPSLGKNAIEAAHAVIGALQTWLESSQAQHHDEDFAVPGPTMNLGRIAGGDSPNRICAECTLDLDVRLLPGMEREATLAEIRGVVQAVVGSDFGVEVTRLGHGAASFEQAGEGALRRALLSVGASKAVMFATEAPFFSALGMETMIFGPGEIAVAHQPNEYVTGGSVQAAIDAYASLIHRLCKQA